MSYLQIIHESMAEMKDLEPKQMRSKIKSRDEEEVNDDDDGDVLYLGTREARRREGGMKMAITVGEVLNQRTNPLPYAWKCYLAKPDT